MWQPIETAPRDATAILVMRDIWPGARSGRAEECNGRNTYVAAWWPDESGGQGAWICYMDAVLDPECPVEPTHWMPLPDAPGAQPAPSVPEGFSREDLEAVADGLDGYEKTVNVGNVTGKGDDHLESTTAYAARFIRAMLAAPEPKP